MTTSHHFFRSCIGWELSSGSSSSSQYSSSAAWTAWLRRTYPATYYVSDLAARQRLRSSSTSTLVIPPTRLSTAGDHAFPVAAARTWNSLSRSLASLPSLASFRCQLKTELFIRSFPDLDSSAHDLIWQILCSHFASHSRFVTVFSVCKVSLQSFDITPPKSFLSIIIIIIILITQW